MSGRIGIGKIVFIITLIFLSSMIHQAVSLDMDIEQNITGYMYRAEYATTAESMANFIELGLAGLEEWNLTEGNWSWIATDNPNTEMSITVQQYENLIVRLESIENNENIGSVDYAMSLDEIKSNFDEINFSPYQLYAKLYAKHLYGLVWSIIFALIMLVGFFTALLTWDIGIIRPSMICATKGHRWNEYTYWDKHDKSKKGYQCSRCYEYKK